MGEPTAPLYKSGIRALLSARLLIHQRLAAWGIRQESLLIGVAALVGVLIAAAAIGFEDTLKFLNYYCFDVLAQLTHIRQYWWLLPLFPAAGGLLVGALTWVRHKTRHAPATASKSDEPELHGLSLVLLKIGRNSPRLPRLMGVENFLLCVLTLGTGGSAGPEAPIAVVGASIGSILGELTGLSWRHLPTLIACGAAGGIAAVFDAPLSGVLFALEVMLRDFSVRTFTPIVVSAVIATALFHTFQGGGVEHRGLFELTQRIAEYDFSLWHVPAFLLLGLLCGGTALYLEKMLRVTGAWFGSFHRVPGFLITGFGGLLSGALGLVFVSIFTGTGFVAADLFGKSYVPTYGSGYSTVKQAIDPAFYEQFVKQNPHAMLILACFFLAAAVVKVGATALTMGSGGVGGMFAPSIFVGACLGGGLGVLLHPFLPHASPATFALVGMSAVLVALIQAPLMGILLLFELTRNYQIMLPAMLAVVTASTIYRLVHSEGIYTMPLRQMGVRIGHGMDWLRLRQITVDQLPLRVAPTVQLRTPLVEVIKISRQTGTMDFVVVNETGTYVGMLLAEDLKWVVLENDTASIMVVADLVRNEILPVQLTDSIEVVQERLVDAGIAVVPVVSANQKLEGVVGRQDTLMRLHAELEGE